MKKLRVSYTTVSRAVKQAEKRGDEMSNLSPDPEIFTPIIKKTQLNAN